MSKSTPIIPSNRSKGKIKILHCIETISSGGVEQTRLTLMKNLPKDRFEIKIICTNARGPIAESLKKEGAELIVLGSMKHPLDWRIHKQVQKVISTFKPHIVHGAVYEGNSMAAISGFLKRVPVIILEETSDPQNRSSKADWLLKQYLKLADKIIAISPDVETYLINKARISKDQISLIPNGVSIPNSIENTLIESTKLRYNIEEDDIVIGFVGRLYNDHKRISDLIGAIALINQSNIKLLIVGDGRDRDLVDERIAKFNLQNQVLRVGFQENTALYYAMMHIFCIPSSREGFGLVAAEAMLHKLPVIATRVGGLQDVVVDGETGYLVPPYKPAVLAEKILTLINNSQLRKEMGKAGYQRAAQNYTADRYCQQVENLYLTLLKQKGILPN